ncbi:MAG: energy transducer TonB [Pseudomonadota bacterium]
MAAVDDPLRPRSPDRPARGAAFALVAHALLVGALSLGVSWRMSTPEGGSAELWSSVPQVAAPQEPAARTEPGPPRPAPPEPRRAEPPPQDERPAELAEKPKPKDSKPKEDKPKADKREEPRKDERKAASAQSTPALQSNREEALRRIMGQAGGQDATTGAPRQGANVPGKGISDSYAGRIVARVRPNVVFPPVLDGNPKAEVEVRAAADGRIVSRRITQSSGVPAWDDAVLRALDRTEVLPLDENGRIPNPMILTFRPRDF